MASTGQVGQVVCACSSGNNAECGMQLPQGLLDPHAVCYATPLNGRIGWNNNKAVSE